VQEAIMGQVTLGELIEILEAAPQDKIVRFGFAEADSYRGYYEELAFEPAENVLVADMLREAKQAMGKTYQGYKGGDYTMTAHTPCWIAKYGHCGEAIGPLLLRYMLET
jgi:hypothetical protein